MAASINGTVLDIESGWNSTATPTIREANVSLPKSYVLVAYSSIAAIGIFGNAFALFIIIRSTKMRRKFTNILIANQSCIDLMTSVLILIIKSLHISGGHLSGIAAELLCRFWTSELPLWSVIISSSYNLMAMTVERNIAIVHPIFYHTSFTTKRVMLLAGATWWPGFLLMLVTVVPTAGVIDGRCYVMAIFASVFWKKVCGVALFVFQFLLPIIVFVVCYARMFMEMRNQVHPQGSTVVPHASVQKARARRNILKTLLVVVIGYLLCNSFNQVSFLAFNFGAPLDFSSHFYNFTVIAMLANCCINPFLYAMQYHTFQDELRKLFCRRENPIAAITSVQTS